MTQVFGVIRTLMAFGAGILVAKGYFDQAMADSIISAVVVLLTAGWSMYEKAKTPAPPAAPPA